MNNIKKLLLVNGILLLTVITGSLFYTNTASVQAATRREACSQGMNASARDRCIEQLNTDAFTECITKPPAERGQCSEDFKNSEAPDQQSAGDTGGSSADRQRDRVEGDKDHIYQQIINPGIIVLSAAVILVIVINVVVGGIQYTTSNGNSSAVAAAKNRIFVALVCLIVYVFGFALLQWLIPGGIR